MDQFAVFIDGADIELLDGLDSDSRRRAASQAINRIAKETRTDMAREIRRRVNLPSSYVSPSGRRLAVSKFASPNSLQAEIFARGRATSLARFVTSSGGVNTAGVSVSVVPGKVVDLKRAFLIRLPQGSAEVTDTKNNLGLAVRLRPGEMLRNKYSASRVAKGLYVLYGPSVAQIFEANDGKGLKDEMIPEIETRLEAEFLRLIGR